jgi:hypothetical protein
MNWSFHFRISNLFVFLFHVVARLDALPRQTALGEVDEDVADALQVVPPALRLAEVAVNAHVPVGDKNRNSVNKLKQKFRQKVDGMCFQFEYCLFIEPLNIIKRACEILFETRAQFCKTFRLLTQ